MADAQIHAPAKLSDGGGDILWFSDQTAKVVEELFKTCESMVCIFSLGAVIRLIAPVLRDKKTDPAVLVIDDKATYVISALSGHLGGANALARTIGAILDASPVITTAADVNETIPVDLVGRQFGWTIEDFANVTSTSALMVNEESIAVYQEAGEKTWWTSKLPKNVTLVNSLEDAVAGEFKGALVISDRIFKDSRILNKAVIYRPKSLVVGVGLHWDTGADTIEAGIRQVFERENLSVKCIRTICTADRGAKVKGLEEFGKLWNLPVNYFSKESLNSVEVPNPSEVVRKFESTASVSEAASILGSQSGSLIVQKQKFPPNLTVAVSRFAFGETK
ncbi:MAG: cobalamin biosynthesis protein [Nitrososphaera sp.]